MYVLFSAGLNRLNILDSNYNAILGTQGDYKAHNRFGAVQHELINRRKLSLYDLNALLSEMCSIIIRLRQSYWRLNNREINESIDAKSI